MSGMTKKERVKEGFGYDIMEEIMDPTGMVRDSRGPEWKWECSDEMRKTLDNMGIFQEVERQMRLIHNSSTKSAIDVATKKLDALNKVISILKTSQAVYKDSGSQDIEEGIDSVEIVLKRDE